MNQRLMGLSVPLNGETGTHVRLFPRVEAKKTAPADLLASLLKRQARTAMQDITEAPAEAVPAHLVRLRDLREQVAFHLRHTFDGTPEAVLSGRQLIFAATLADFLLCLDHTSKTHRAPSCLNSRDRDMAEIKTMFNALAACLGMRLEAERQAGCADDVEALIEQFNAEHEAWGKGGAL